MQEILRKILEKEIEDKGVLDQIRTRFREGKGTAEAIYVLKKVIEGEKKRERESGSVLCVYESV